MKTLLALGTFVVACQILMGCKDKQAPEAAPLASPTTVPAGNVVRTPEAVKAAFVAFMDASKAHRGADAEACVDAQTVTEFAHERELALNARREDLKRETFGTKMHVISLRG